eukprot:scaffold1449_cov108-Isochrysis_galbana.AAC.5
MAGTRSDAERPRCGAHRSRSAVRTLHPRPCRSHQRVHAPTPARPHTHNRPPFDGLAQPWPQSTKGDRHPDLPPERGATRCRK